MLDRVVVPELVLGMLIAVIEQTVEAIDEILEMPREYALSLINAEEVVVSSKRVQRKRVEGVIVG